MDAKRIADELVEGAEKFEKEAARMREAASILKGTQQRRGRKKPGPKRRATAGRRTPVASVPEGPLLPSSDSSDSPMPSTSVNTDGSHSTETTAADAGMDPALPP